MRLTGNQSGSLTDAAELTHESLGVEKLYLRKDRHFTAVYAGIVDDYDHEIGKEKEVALGLWKPH